MDLEALVREYGDRIYNLAFRMTGNADDAEDIVQETFLQAHRNLHKFRGDCAVYTWLYRIALNAGLRSKARLDAGFMASLDAATEAFAGDIPDDVERWQRDPESRYLYEELLDEIQRACIHFVTRRLTDEQRAVYVLRVMVGLSLDEITQILGENKNAIKARLQRAKAALREYFSGHCQWASGTGTCSCESKLGFAVTAAPEILKKLRDHPPNEQTRTMVRATVLDVTDPDTIRRLYPQRSLEEDVIQRILAE